MAEEVNETPTGGGGLSPMIFFGGLAGTWVLMAATGYVMAVMVLPEASGAKAPEGEAYVDKDEKGEMKDSDKKESKDKSSDKAYAKEKDKGGSKDKKGGKGKGNDEPVEVSEFILTDVLVNVAGTRATRFVKVSLFFEGSRTSLNTLEENRAKVIDLVSTSLASKDLAEVTSADARAKLRKEFLLLANTVTPKHKVKNVYFLDFVVQ